jgi:hypothetical protein
MKPPVKFYWKGNHHAYHGAWIVAFSFFQWYMAIDNGAIANTIPLWQVCIGIGAYMIIDDVIEHKYTADTPLRILWIKYILPRLKK